MNRPFPSFLLALWVAPLLVACVGDVGLTPMEPAPEPFAPAEVEAAVNLADLGGFADQTGGGIFVDHDGKALRLRLDGSLALMASHPGNPLEPGRVSSLWPLGPTGALLEADNGLFIANAGWIIAPPWSGLLGPGVRSAVQTVDGSAWIAHETGLYRVVAGVLSSYKLDGQSLTGITQLAAVRTSDGSEDLWMVRDGQVWSLERSTALTFTAKLAHTPLESDEAAVGLFALTASENGSAEVWVQSATRLWRGGNDGWREVQLPQAAEQVRGAGRTVWIRMGQRLWTFDADQDRWGEASDLDASTVSLLASDAAGCAWVRHADGRTVALTRGRPPRIGGLPQGTRLLDDGVVVRAFPPPGPALERLVYRAGSRQVEVRDMPFSLGGFESDGSLKAFSVSSLGPGLHELVAVAHYADGTMGERRLGFEFRPMLARVLSWEADVKPIFNSRCAHCHTAGPGRTLNTYALWSENAELIATAVRDQRMPADGPLDPLFITTIQRWVSSGALP